jgi:hypothetical protein
MEGRLPSKLQKQKARGAGRTMNECKLRGPKIDGADHTEGLVIVIAGGSKAVTTWGLSLSIP